MAHHFAPESSNILNILSDGEWHDREEVVNRATDMVPPGRALRRWESRDQVQRRYQPRVGVPPTDDEKIRQGQRNLVQSAINSLKGRHIEIKVSEDGKFSQMRCRPAEERPPPPSSARKRPAAQPAATDQSYPDDQLATLVRKEIDQALNIFQQSMQSWLGKRFAELRGTSVDNRSKHRP